MLSHPETEGTLHAALWGNSVPPEVTAVGDVAQRFSVYRNNVHHSLGEALGERFPVVRRLVGPAFFAAAARDFVCAHPPASPVLAEYGAAFPAFLAGLAPLAGLPYLADVARLEWLRGRAYHAADAEALPASAFHKAVSMADGDVEVSLHPSVSLFTSSHPAVSIWRANHGGETEPIMPGSEAALVFRHGDAVPVRPVPPRLMPTLAAVRSGASLSAIAAHRGEAAEALSLLLQHGLVTGLTSRSTPEETP